MEIDLVILMIHLSDTIEQVGVYLDYDTIKQVDVYLDIIKQVDVYLDYI